MPTSASARYTVRKLEPAHPAPPAATASVPFAQGTYARGTVLGQVSATGKYKAYANGNSDGSQEARAIAVYDMSVDSSGNVTLGSGSAGHEHGGTLLSAPVYTAGAFRVEELTGLDSNAVADLGRLVSGDTTSGLLHVM